MVVYTQNETVCSCCQTKIESIDFFLYIYIFLLKKNLWEILNNIPRALNETTASNSACIDQLVCQCQRKHEQMGMLSEKISFMVDFYISWKLYLLWSVILFESKQMMAGKHTDYLILSILFCCCAEGDKQVEKLKAVTTKLPHLPVVRITADAGSVPLSRGSEARSVSFVSSQVKIAFCQTVFFFLLTLDRVLVEARKGSFFSFSFSLSPLAAFFF